MKDYRPFPILIEVKFIWYFLYIDTVIPLYVFILFYSILLLLLNQDNE